MKKSVILLLACVSVSSFAVGRGGRITRGGFGFLFPDHNAFTNPGQFSIERGLAFQGTMDQNNGTALQTAVPSVVFGNGAFGFGLYADRSGTSVLAGDTSVDVVGGGVGLSLGKEAITVGVGFSAPVEDGTTSPMQIQGTLTLNGAKRMGFNMGLGFTTTLNQASGDVRKGTFAMGYGFGAANFELVGDFNDFSNITNSDVSAYLNWQPSAIYLATGYTYGVDDHSSLLKGRLGLVLGGFDVSGYLYYPLENTSSFTLGGSARFAL